MDFFLKELYRSSTDVSFDLLLDLNEVFQLAKAENIRKNVIYRDTDS